MNKHILITGAGGYIGSKMVVSFLKKGYFITALDRYFFGNVFNDLKGNESLNIVKDDIRSFNKRLLKNVDIVIDLAAISSDIASELNPKITYDINCRGTLRVAHLAKEMGVKKYIFSSTCNVYGAGDGFFDETSKVLPTTVYSKSKAIAEKEVIKLADKNFTVTIIRNAPVYGLSERRMRFDLIVNAMTLDALRKNKIKILGGGKQWRPLLHISDCINAFLSIIEEKDLSRVQRQAFNVGSNKQNFQVYKIAEIIRKNFPNVVIQNVEWNRDKISYRANFDKIEKVLNFKTQKTVDDGIKEIKDALKKKLIVDSQKNRILQRYKNLLSKKKLNIILGETK